MFILFAVGLSSCSSINIPKETMTNCIKLFEEQSAETSVYSFVSSNTYITYLFNPKSNGKLPKGIKSDFQLKITQLNNRSFPVQLWNQRGDTLTKVVKGKYSGKAFKFKNSFCERKSSCLGNRLK